MMVCVSSNGIRSIFELQDRLWSRFSWVGCPSKLGLGYTGSYRVTLRQIRHKLQEVKQLQTPWIGFRSIPKLIKADRLLCPDVAYLRSPSSEFALSLISPIRLVHFSGFRPISGPWILFRDPRLYLMHAVSQRRKRFMEMQLFIKTNSTSNSNCLFCYRKKTHSLRVFGQETGRSMFKLYLFLFTACTSSTVICARRPVT